MSNFTKIGTSHNFNTLNSKLGSKFRNFSNLLFYCQFFCSIVKNPLFSKTLLKLCEISQFGTRHNLNPLNSKLGSKFSNFSNIFFYCQFFCSTSGLRPYDFEPVGTPVTSSSESGNDELNSTAGNSRIGTTDWCTCGNCRPMGTDNESICCQEAVPGDFFNGDNCILNHEDFIAICGNSAVLRMTLTAINDLQCNTLPDNNKSLRYAGYRCYTWWIHSRLGRGVRKAVPSCAVWTIRDKYPDPTNNYVPFKE